MLRDDINNAVKDAMRAKDERKLSTLRMVNSTIKNADIDARGQGKPPLSDADLLGVFQKMIKQRQESVELYDKGGRAELAAQEREEIAIISAYLPKQMSDDEVQAAISAAVAETGAAGMKDMGKVIGVLRAKYAGQIGFRQGQRPGEGGADGIARWLSTWVSGTFPSAAHLSWEWRFEVERGGGRKTWLISKPRPPVPIYPKASPRPNCQERRCSAMSAMKKSCWCVRAPGFSRSTPIAAIIMARSPKGW